MMIEKLAHVYGQSEFLDPNYASKSKSVVSLFFLGLAPNSSRE